ncbi:hypothetical protein KEM55_002274, partial [Ascosphaera atra]
HDQSAAATAEPAAATTITTTAAAPEPVANADAEEDVGGEERGEVKDSQVVTSVEGDKAGRDDGSDSDDIVSESYPSPAFVAVSTPKRDLAGRVAGGNPSDETLMAARRRRDSPLIPLVYHYKVCRNGEDEDTTRLIDVDLARGKRLVRESWEKWDWEDPTLAAGAMAQCGDELAEEKCSRCKGSGAVFDECVINPLWGTICVACLTRGAPNRCRWCDPSEVKPRPSWVKETSPKKKGGVEKWAVASFEAVRDNHFVKLGEWAASAGAGDWEVAIGKAKKMLEACHAGHEYAKRDVVGAALGRH